MIILTAEEIKNGISDPKLSHKIPVNNEPVIIAKLLKVASNPIAVPFCSSGTKSETHAFEIPSVDAEYRP